MKIVALVLLFLTAQTVSAQDWARASVDSSPRHHEWVTVKHDNRAVESFIAYPESKDKRPVVVVIHTINAMIDWVQDVSDQLAEAGYIAIAPDLLSGMGPNGGRTSDFAAGTVNEAISHLKPDQITADLNAVADYAKKLPASNGKLIVIGFCWGGNESFRFATNRSDLSAAFVFYGTPPDKDAMVRIKAPVYAFYGGNDNRVTSTIPAASEGMKASGKTYEAEIYDGAGHGFMQNGEAPGAKPADAKARTDSWVRLKALLERTN